jgi:O-antigen ligase
MIRRRFVGNRARSIAVGLGGAGTLGAAIGVVSVAVSPLVPAGALVGIAGVGAILRSPLVAVLGFAIVACLLPFAVIPLRIGVALTAVDVLLTLLLLVWVLRLLRRRGEVIGTPIDGVVVLFLGSALVSFILGSGYAALGGEQFRSFLKLLNSVLFFFGVVQVVREREDLERVLRVLLLAGGAAGALAIGLYALPRETAERLLSSLRPLGYPSGPDVVRTIASTETIRAVGTSIDPNVLGGMLMVIAVLSAAFLVGTQSLLPRGVLLAVLACAVGGIVLSYSRSSWVGVAAGIGFLAGFRDRRAWVLIGVAVAALAVLPQGSMLLDRFTSGLQARDQAAAMRVGEYSDAFRLIAQYPWLGVGFGEAPTIELYVAVSSIYLLIAEEMGLIGLAIFLAAIGAAILRSFRVGRSDAIAVGLQATLIAALVAGLFDHYFFNMRFPHMVALFWMLVALLLRSSDLAERRRGDVKLFTPQPRLTKI